MENKYNGHMVIMLFYYIHNRCLKLKGTKYQFFKQLKDKADKKTIYKFLNTLEQYNAIELVNEKNSLYIINRKNLKVAFLSYKEGQMANSLVQDMLDLAV